MKYSMQTSHFPGLKVLVNRCRIACFMLRGVLGDFGICKVEFDMGPRSSLMTKGDLGLEIGECSISMIGSVGNRLCLPAGVAILV